MRRLLFFGKKVESSEGFSVEEVFVNAKLALEQFFLMHGLKDIHVELSSEKPTQDAGSGKFKHIIRK